MSRRVAWPACIGLVLAGGVGLAQVDTFPEIPEYPIYRSPTPVLTLDQDRLFAESAYGRRVAAQIEAESAALATENRRIERELTEEERALTEARATLTPEDFRARADAFDEKVVSLRLAQDAKGRALQRRGDAERQAFFEAVLPVLAELVLVSGAVAILDERAVLFSAQAVDVTDRAIAEIDAAIGEGDPVALTEPGGQSNGTSSIEGESPTESER